MVKEPNANAGPGVYCRHDSTGTFVKSSLRGREADAVLEGLIDSLCRCAKRHSLQAVMVHVIMTWMDEVWKF